MLATDVLVGLMEPGILLRICAAIVDGTSFVEVYHNSGQWMTETEESV